MARLIVHVEGVTEEEFVNALLAPHLLAHGWESFVAYRMGRARSRERRHGVKGWDVALDGILRHLRSDSVCCVTTLVDYYGLPMTGVRAWPGRADAEAQPLVVRGRSVQQALSGHVAQATAGTALARRFIPFVVMHEFEGLLFSDCGRFAQAIGRPDLGGRLQTIRDGFSTPEEINDSPIAAPSKRVTALVPDYDKAVMGVLAALAIGLDAIRAECTHFRQWLEYLETWPRPH